MKTERLFFARTRLCILFLLCVFAHGAFAQSDAGAKLNPWFSQLDLSFASGGTYANIKEFVYKKNSAGKYALLSRLDWKDIFMWTVGAKLGCDINRWRFVFDFSTALPVPGPSSMQDRDWKTLDSALTDYSEHPMRLDSFFGTGASLAYRFFDTEVLILGAGAGFAYTATNLTAYDGSAFLPSQKNYSGDVVSYSQRIYEPRIMLYGEWKPFSLFETHARLFVSPFTFIRATDTHYAIVDASGASLAPAIGKQYSDRPFGPASFKAELALRFNLPQKKSAGETESEKRTHPASVRHAIALQADAAFVPELKGASYSRSSKSLPFAKTGDKAGSSYFSFGISLAYCMRIR
ncbi:hypothetical protein HMPREF9194_00050 [Treponema maltophilum ATCC 51939]|uniref:Outer membrane protein beta-barrel domain-containing protein n=1 Tax=Treponema maltophilum ATCC 51939 TaxID=1125699 RepID=S3KIK2_TREMA|nr:omptin family outer membrane protease [Treponema maltophilum]EPF32062.1 hypothetical protein HMPREF9194_00050 [Treponema maltophilum ATCC 51939]